jgi:prepilin-type N-terminal cleavage/methylation domain-containing protein
MLNRNNKKYFSKGFSLVELSIVLTIIGIVLGNLLSIAAHRTDAAKIKETEEILTKVEQAFAQYFTEHRRIPCPAYSSSSPSSAAFGVNTTAWAPYICYGNAGVGGGLLSTGAVPTKTLQIPDEYAFDAWGRRITYAMVQNCNAADISTYNNYSGTDNIGYSCGYGSPDYGYRILNSSGNVTTNYAQIVLVSHGKNGKGAWTRSGSGKITASSDADEAENSDDDYIFVQKSKNSTFDDIVRFKTLEQIINDGKGINRNSSLNGYLCTIASTITSTTPAIICGSSSPATCATYMGTFATQITNLCFEPDSAFR